MQRKSRGAGWLAALGAALLLTALLAAGCGHTGETGTASEAQTEVSGPRIGIVFDSFVIERWERDRDVFTSTAKELGADVLVGNANGDKDEQKKLIQHMIDNKVDVLAVIAVDGSDLTQSVAEAHKAGIKVISYDRIIENADTDLYITFDNFEVGKYMAEAINEALPEGGTYMKLQGSPTDHNVDMVNEGFDAAIADNLTQVDYMSCTNWDDTEAFAYLTNHPEDLTEADAFMCGNDAVAGQAVRALAERRLAGKKAVTGQDADLSACQRIAEGTQTMTVYKPIERLAGEAAQIAVDMAQGKDPDTEETISDGTYDIPYIALDPIKVTKDTLEETVIDGGFHNREDVYLHVGEASTQ
ncbi:MAG: substrate-binding domain-containing protein [Lachnospiraceae bacterium]